ncbi:sulfotransferase [Lutibacter sp. HS1-25]|uniref:sulfotransferase family protein n=1 Tax=Lutibacter sp. HS1-25 TaxID=2485000 RepID=UPI001011C532|nr:sulfotransferase [Lutibacter sp. HS1-25]RXP45405.1 sulfotransferase [Lutibacter sp. HS1-25]
MNQCHKELPNFLIIGAMKCGTTSLHDYLGKHPEIYTTNPKEIHFFTKDIYNPALLNEYLSNFKSNKKISGASPQNYTKRHRIDFSGVPERLYKHAPNIKLIYVVRDPIKRIISHYNEAQEGGYAPEQSFNNYLVEYKNNHYVKTSMYYYQLQAYLEYFSMDQILVIESERLLTNRLETLNTVFDFLGVSKMKDESIFNYETNASTQKLRKNTMGSILFDSKLNVLKNILPHKIRTVLKKNRITEKLTRTAIIQEKIEPALEKEIRDYLKEDVKQLRLLTGQKFESWSL